MFQTLGTLAIFSPKPPKSNQSHPQEYDRQLEEALDYVDEYKMEWEKSSALTSKAAIFLSLKDLCWGSGVRGGTFVEGGFCFFGGFHNSWVS